MPGIGVRTGTRILIDVGDGSAFPSAAHLASYAGLTPATRSSGSSIHGEQPSRRGNKQLKRAFFLSAFTALTDPASRTYYGKKIEQASTTPKPFSASRDDEPTCSSRCSAMAPSTSRSQRPSHDLRVAQQHHTVGPDVEAENRVEWIRIQAQQHRLTEPMPYRPQQTAQHIHATLTLQLPQINVEVDRASLIHPKDH